MVALFSSFWWIANRKKIVSNCTLFSKQWSLLFVKSTATKNWINLDDNLDISFYWYFFFLWFTTFYRSKHATFFYHTFSKNQILYISDQLSIMAKDPIFFINTQKKNIKLWNLSTVWLKFEKYPIRLTNNRIWDKLPVNH